MLSLLKIMYIFKHKFELKPIQKVSQIAEIYQITF